VYMHKAGYNPTGAITLQELFKEHHDSAGGWLATHPSSISRVQANRESRDEVGGDEGYLGEAEYRIYTRKLRKQAPAYQKIELGLKALQAGDAEEALRKSLDARRIAPEEAHAIALSAKAYEKLGNRKAALEAWDQAVERNPGWYLPWLERAMLREKAGDSVGALSDYKRSLALLPTELAQKGIRRLSR